MEQPIENINLPSQEYFTENNVPDFDETGPTQIFNEAEFLENTTSAKDDLNGLLQKIQGEEIKSAYEQVAEKIAKIDSDWEVNANSLTHALDNLAERGLDTTAFVILFCMVSNLRQQLCLERSSLYYSLLQNMELTKKIQTRPRPRVYRPAAKKNTPAKKRNEKKERNVKKPRAPRKDQKKKIVEKKYTSPEFCE